MADYRTITLKKPGYNNPEIGSIRDSVDALTKEARNGSKAALMNSVWTAGNYKAPSMKGVDTMTKITGAVALITGVTAGVTAVAGAINAFKKPGSSNNNVVDAGKQETKADINDLNSAIYQRNKNGKVDELKNKINEKQAVFDTQQNKIDHWLDNVTEEKGKKETAFGTAKSTLDKANEYLKTQQNDEKDAKETFDSAKNNLDTIQQEYDKADPDGKKLLESKLTDAKDQYQKRLKEYDEAKSAREEADKQCKTASKDLTEAKKALDIATNDLNIKTKEKSELQAQNNQLGTTIKAAEAALPDYAKETKKTDTETKTDSDNEVAEEEEGGGLDRSFKPSGSNAIQGETTSIKIPTTEQNKGFDFSFGLDKLSNKDKSTDNIKFPYANPNMTYTTQTPVSTPLEIAKKNFEDADRKCTELEIEYSRKYGNGGNSQERADLGFKVKDAQDARDEAKAKYEALNK